MKKHFILIPLFAPLYLFSQSYTLTPTVLATAGNYSTGVGGSLSWTLGELATQTLTSGTGIPILTQGFQQSFEFDLVATLELGSRSVNVNVYPNPSPGFVTMDYQEAFAHYLAVADMSGRVLFSRKSDSAADELDLSHLPDGTYLITIYPENASASLTLKLLKL